MNRLYSFLGLLIIGGAYFAVITYEAESQDVPPVFPVQILSEDESRVAQVDLINGKNRLLTSSITVVDQVFGRDPHGTTWFYIGTADDASGVGVAGDTVRVQIPAAVTPLGVIYPAVDVTTTVTTAHTLADNPERELALDICSDLNGDTNFINAKWKCIVIKDHSGVFIESKLFNEFGERTTWTLSSTGTTVVQQGYNTIERRGLPTELSRSPNDPRQGILGIAGSVTAVPGGVADILLENLLSPTLSADMRVNGVITPTHFRLDCDPVKNRLIEEIRFYGGCNGLKFGQFLCSNTVLSNGISIEIVSEQNSLLLPILKSTEDFKNKFAFGGGGPGASFRIDIQAGGDQFIASYLFTSPAIIEKCGTNPTGNDYIDVFIQDRMDNIGLFEFQSLVKGFEEEV